MSACPLQLQQHPGMAGSTHSETGLGRIQRPASPPPAFQQPLQSHEAKRKRTSSSAAPQPGSPQPDAGMADPSPASKTDLHDTAQRPHI